MGSSLLLWLAAAVWVDWRSRGAAGGVHHGDGDGQAVVQEKGAALAAQPAWEKHTEEQASVMAWCAACPAVLAQSHGEQRQPQELQDLRKRRQEQGRWQQHWVQHRRWQRQGLRGPERGAEVQDVGDGEARVEGVGGGSGAIVRGGGLPVFTNKRPHNSLRAAAT